MKRWNAYDRMSREEITEAVENGTIEKVLLRRALVASIALNISETVGKQHKFIVGKITPPPRDISGLGKVDWAIMVHKRQFDITRELLDDEEFLEEIRKKLREIEDNTFVAVANKIDEFLDKRYVGKKRF